MTLIILIIKGVSIEDRILEWGRGLIFVIHSFIHLIKIYYTRNGPSAKGYGDEQDLFLFFEELRALHIGRTYERMTYDT